MVAIPQPINHTVDAIYKALAAGRASSYEGMGISISQLGEECDRSLWYTFRWAAKQEEITGLKAITFETGDIEEQRLLNALRLIGCEVVDVDDKGKQFRFTAAHGHVRGKSDAKVQGVPEAPAAWHLAECKSMQEKYFKQVVKKGVKDAYYTHWVQCNIYAYLAGIDRCLYIVRNKNTGEIYTERWATDNDAAIKIIARAERIINAAEPPVRLHEDPMAKTAFRCGYCRFKAQCHEKAFARVHCRTCIHATPEKHGDATWSCARWAKPLNLDEQRQGCPAHLYIPALVPGELTDSNETEEWIEYRLANGAAWRDGVGKAPTEQKEQG